jgi:hypothetical protein
MYAELADALTWTIRLVLLAGLAWGGWLCIAQALPPARSAEGFRFERFAGFAVLVLLLTTLAGIFHAG